MFPLDYNFVVFSFSSFLSKFALNLYRFFPLLMSFFLTISYYLLTHIFAITILWSLCEENEFTTTTSCTICLCCVSKCVWSLLFDKPIPRYPMYFSEYEYFFRVGIQNFIYRIPGHLRDRNQ